MLEMKELCVLLLIGAVLLPAFAAGRVGPRERRAGHAR